MNWLIENWEGILGLMIVAFVCGLSFYQFVTKPKEEQIKSLKEWLLFAVVEAEKWFGSKMGVMKLRYVYDMFLAKFPALSKIVSFEMFSGFVDEALEKIKPLIESNKSLSDYIEE